MQILARLYPVLIVCSVLGFHKGFLEFVFGGFLLMDCAACLKHFLALDHEFECGFFLFGSFGGVSKILCLFLFFVFGLKFLHSDKFSRSNLVRLVCDLRGELKNGVWSKNVPDKKLRMLNFYLIDKVEEIEEKSELYVDSDEKLNPDSDEESITEDDEDEDRDEDGESDISTLRRMLKIERYRVNEARAELARERAASATAADEAMAMILRLQNEKSLIEMDSSQYRRLAEEKQIHDQEVIRSLRWLVLRHESERSVLEDKLKVCEQRLMRISRDGCEGDEEEVEEAQREFSGSIWDDLENVYYSSRDANLSP